MVHTQDVPPLPMTETRFSIVVSKPCRADLQPRSHVLIHTQDVPPWATVKAGMQEHGTEHGMEILVDNLAEKVDECPLSIVKERMQET